MITFGLEFHLHLFKGGCSLLSTHMNFSKIFGNLSNGRPAFETIGLVLLETSCQQQCTFKLMGGSVSPSKMDKAT